MSAAIDLAVCVDQAAQRNPQQLFLTDTVAGTQSYAMLREHSGRIAAALMQCGVRPGDRVTVQVEKSVQAVTLYVACLRLGAVFVPINVANTVNEVEYFFADAQPQVAVIRPEDRQVIEALAVR